MKFIFIDLYRNSYLFFKIANKLDKVFKRKGISLEYKIQVLDNLKQGSGASEVGRKFCLSEFTVRTIKKNEISIGKSVMSGRKQR